MIVTGRIEIYGVGVALFLAGYHPDILQVGVCGKIVCSCRLVALLFPTELEKRPNEMLR
jgi:hypothetical protein